MSIPNASPALYNEDLAPATERKWGVFSIFNVWTSDVHSLWGYYLAASLFLLCGSFVNFLIAIGLSSLVIFFLMNLVGYAGVKTGVPYPVLARASFGIWGANVPALVRAIVACFWYGAQTAAASGAIVALLTRTDTFLAFHKSTHVLGHSGLEVICFVVIWALQLLIIQKGMETVRRFQDWAGPAVWVMMLVLAVGLFFKAGGFSFDHGIPQDVLLAATKDAGVAGAPGSRQRCWPSAPRGSLTSRRCTSISATSRGMRPARKRCARGTCGDCRSTSCCSRSSPASRRSRRSRSMARC
jgi:NCS1 family nucleobase:cation symporter-1